MTTVPEPELVTIAPATTAVLRATVPMAALRDFFDAAFRALAEALAAQGVAPVGPAFGRYRGTFGDPVDIEVGFATDRAVRPDGEVVAEALPGGRVARMVHAGAYDGLGESWERLHGWITEQGLSAEPHRWEVYPTQPSPDMDPRTLRTELNWPVAD
ncbi:GyrI-like domain-containing protein [Kitasatospora sp. NBC_00039]|uniref:GyrI-like domain-containing protein n=1 Tax=Kitasatospora sp. NBC_00039 TaxID=2903565 RepID=UPI002F90F09E